MDQHVIESLLIMARGCVPSHLRGKISPEDVVQDTLIKLHESNGKFENRTTAEHRAYVRSAFVTTLADRIRHFDRSKRTATLERSLDAALDESSARIEQWLVSGHSSPSTKAARNEQLVLLAEAIAALPADQKCAVELHHLQRLSLGETAKHMGRSHDSVAGLIRRATKTLRERLVVNESP